MGPKSPAILFWFHRDVSLCKNRLRMLRRSNPGIPIYGLYGGAAGQTSVFQRALAPFLDDFFEGARDRDARWKWENGDLMITEWFRDRGKSMAWDTIVVVQWDLLVFGRISDVFSELGEGEILLSTLRPVEEISSHWTWARPDRPRNRERFLAFVEHLKNRYGFNGPLMASHFIVACLPRRFLELYSEVEQPELGFFEYRLPTYAKLFQIPVRASKRFDTWWEHAPGAGKTPWRERVMFPNKPERDSVFLTVVLYHLLRRSGSRLFHPFLYAFPGDLPGAFSFLLNKQHLADFRKVLRKLASVLRSAAMKCYPLRSTGRNGPASHENGRKA